MDNLPFKFACCLEVEHLNCFRVCPIIPSECINCVILTSPSSLSQQCERFLALFFLKGAICMKNPWNGFLISSKQPNAISLRKRYRSEMAWNLELFYSFLKQLELPDWLRLGNIQDLNSAKPFSTKAVKKAPSTWIQNTAARPLSATYQLWKFQPGVIFRIVDFSISHNLGSIDTS